MVKNGEYYEKYSLSILALTVFNAVQAMQQPVQNEITDYVAKHSIVSSIEKAHTTHDAVKTINELIKSPALSKQAQEGYFDQLIVDAVQKNFQGLCYRFSN